MTNAARFRAGLAAIVLAFGCGGRGPSQEREIDAVASAAFDERKVPGLAVAVLQGDDVLFSRGYGVADVERPEPVSATTVFQLGSISKQFLAALVLRLAEQQRFSIAEPVRRYLPEFTNLPPEILVEHLLNHTSGIREPFTMPEYGAGIEDLSRSAEEMVNILKRAPVDFPPGSRWSYSNANYMILALLVERVAGEPYEHVMAEVLFRPHGLASLRQCTPLPRGPDEARGHVLREGTVTPAAAENMSWIRGDGGICGHAPDVARWFRLLATGRALTSPSYHSMTSPTRLSNGSQADYGFGLSLVAPDGLRKVAHNGAMLGFSASAAYYPDPATTVVVLTNRGDVRTESIERRIARRLLGLPEPVRVEQPLTAEAKRRFAGSYDIGVFTVHVVDRGARLWLEMPSPGPRTPLVYLGNGELVSESDPDAFRLTFGGGDGPAEEVRLLMAAMHWYGTRAETP